MNPCPLVLETTVLPTELFSFINEKMKFKLYILEIKNRLILTIFAFVTCILTSYYYRETLLFLTIKSLNSETRFLYFISTNITEIITSYFKLSYISSIILIAILLIYHILIFFKPAITFKEYNNIKQYFKTSLYIFFSGIFIFNYYLLPLLWNFFLNFQNLYSIKNINVYFESKLEEYIIFYTDTCFLIFIISQLCVVLLIILNYTKDKILFIKNFRKAIYCFFLLISTTITPPDVFSQLITFIFFITFFENLVLIIVFKNNLIRQPIKT